MTRIASKSGASEPFGTQVAAGQVYKAGGVHKFGHNPAVGTTYEPISIGGVYQTPQSATTLRIKSGGDANDTAAVSVDMEIILIAD